MRLWGRLFWWNTFFDRVGVFREAWKLVGLGRGVGG